MGLHEKSRNYLFREFVLRNYQGAKGKVKKNLLGIRPDDIMLYKADWQLSCSVRLEIIKSAEEKKFCIKPFDEAYAIIKRVLPFRDESFYCIKNDDEYARAGTKKKSKYPDTIRRFPDAIEKIIIKKYSGLRSGKLEEAEWSRQLFSQLPEKTEIFLLHDGTIPLRLFVYEVKSDALVTESTINESITLCFTLAAAFSGMQAG